MDLRRLRYFVEVTEQGSFSLAARRINIAQPALSRHIRQLEEELGVVLLRRNGRGVQATEVGEMVLQHARSLLEQTDHLVSEVKGLSGVPTGVVVVGMSPSVCLILAEPLFRRVRKEMPAVRLRISEAFSGDLREWLLSGRLHTAVIYRSGRYPNVEGKDLLVEDMFLVGRSGSLGSARRIALRDVAGLPLIIPGSPHGLRLLIDSACAEIGIDVDVVLELDAMATIKNLVECGDAYTILPYGGVHSEVEAGRLDALRIVEPSITRCLALAESQRRTQTLASKAVVQCILDEVQHLTEERKWTGPD
jgi:LysR family nitrogen assimilation transcriptional regulator